METQATHRADDTAILQSGECLVGKITKPFVQNGKLMGAILSFQGKRGTALLLRKDMLGQYKKDRLTCLRIGDELLVNIIVSEGQFDRKTWATELNLDVKEVTDRIYANRLTRVLCKVLSRTDYGVHVELLSGPVPGRLGLIRTKNLGNGRPATLGEIISYAPGTVIDAFLLCAHYDFNGSLCIDLILPKIQRSECQPAKT